MQSSHFVSNVAIFSDTQHAVLVKTKNMWLNLIFSGEINLTKLKNNTHLKDFHHMRQGEMYFLNKNTTIKAPTTFP